MALKRFFSLNSLGYIFEHSKFDKALRKAELKKTEPFPWNFNGVENREAYMRLLPDRVFNYNKISYPSILQPMWLVYENVLNCLGQMDISPVKDDLEKNLYDSLNVLIGTMKQEGKSFRLEKNLELGQEKPVVNISDSIIYRGLNVDRSLNKSLKDYHIYFDKDLGTVFFTDHELSDPFGYIDQEKMKRLHSVNRQMILQVLLHIKSPYKLKIYKDDKEISEYKDYTYNQMCMFETQCLEPKVKVKDEKNESYYEWMGKFQPTKFLMADMNDFMQFNPLIRG